ncbi:MAG: hypothetical protein QMD14_00645 [Candidatus Aenigmarchaeota archaeon]|nr:hypothetical protein [Candidatus Aenigmarchaeota archaeon]
MQEKIFYLPFNYVTISPEPRYDRNRGKIIYFISGSSGYDCYE